MTGVLLELDQVSCGYGGKYALVNASLTIEDGDFIGIVGPSGSGKTTLLRTILGTLQPATGTVRRRAKLKLAYVPQVETVNWQFPVTVQLSTPDGAEPLGTPTPFELRAVGLSGLGLGISFGALAVLATWWFTHHRRRRRRERDRTGSLVSP